MNGQTATGVPMVVVLATGTTTRQKVKTEKIPRILMEVGGRPFLEHQLNLWRKQGIRRIHFCLGHLGEKILDYLEEHIDWQWELELSWSFDGKKGLGSGGMIKDALVHLDSHFLVVQGDHYHDCDWSLLWAHPGREQFKALTLLYCNDQILENNPFRVTAAGRVVASSGPGEGPALSDYGLAIYDKSLFAQFTPAVFELEEFWHLLMAQQELGGVVVNLPALDISTLRRGEELACYLREQRRGGDDHLHLERDRARKAS